MNFKGKMACAKFVTAKIQLPDRLTVNFWLGPTVSLAIASTNVPKLSPYVVDQLLRLGAIDTQ